MKGKFYIISLGPGEPEALTIGALKALNISDIIFVPNRSKGTDWKNSVSFRIICNLKAKYKEWFDKSGETFEFVNELEKKLVPVYTPMNYDRDSWNEQVEKVIIACKKYENVGYVTLGDAGVNSSAYYILDIIKDSHPEIYENTEVIAGITSFSYASSKVKKPLCLGDSKMEVLPIYCDDVKSTKVYMRIHKGLDLTDLAGEELYYFKNLGFDNEYFSKGSPGVVDNYLTLVIDFANNYTPKQMSREEQA